LNIKKFSNFLKLINSKFGGKKISCENCIKFVQSKRTMMETKRSKIENKILKDQMNFAEQKLVEILFLFISNFGKLLKNKVDDDEIYTFLLYLKEKFKNYSEISYKIEEVIEKLEIDKEIIQTKLYWSIIYESLEKCVKDEIRRSFKENGFHKFNQDSLQIYLQNRHKIIFGMIAQQIINLYPKSAGLILSQDEILEHSEEILLNINTIINEIYLEARKIKIISENEINKIEEEFYKDMDCYMKDLMS
jgi:hypothetical protein